MKTIVQARIPGRSGLWNLFVKGKRILEISQRPAEGLVIDARGLLLTASFIDLHTHMREPGFEQKGTFSSESHACARGGYTRVVAMPNTRPCPDSVSHLQKIRSLLPRAVIPIEIAGSVSRGEQGVTLSDMEELHQEGVRCFSDDGMPVLSEPMMREALEILQPLGGVIMVHEEDRSFFQDGSFRRGALSDQLGLDGFPAEAEWGMVQRDLELLEQCGGQLHVCHLSTKESVDLIRAAKAKGLKVTAEVTPHHLSLCCEEVLKQGAMAKVNPPLGEEADRLALIEGLKDGTIDVIATDHAPHEMRSKERPLSEASFGFSGIELSFAVLNTYLVQPGHLSLTELFPCMNTRPAEILGLKNEGILEEGMKANLILIDEKVRWQVTPETLSSQGKNTPFLGRTLQGRICLTMLEGDIIYEEIDPSDAGKELHCLSGN